MDPAVATGSATARSRVSGPYSSEPCSLKPKISSRRKSGRGHFPFAHVANRAPEWGDPSGESREDHVPGHLRVRSDRGANNKPSRNTT